MPGLLEQAMGPAPQTGQPPGLGTVPPQGTAPPGQPPGQAPGFDQKELDIFIANGMKMIHSEKISDTIISRVKNAKDPIKPLSDVTLNIVNRLEQSSAAAGKKLSLATLAYGANALLGELIASAEAAGMKKMDDEAKYYAMALTVSRYLDDAIKTGKMTKEELAQLGQEAEASPGGQKMKQYTGGEEIPSEGAPPEGVSPEGRI